jgi:hypothetical protein
MLKEQTAGNRELHERILLAIRASVESFIVQWFGVVT